MARTGAKAWITRVVPRDLERAVYVWIASVLFLAVCWLWQPLPGAAWSIAGVAFWVLSGIQMLGVALTLRAASIVGVWELAGVKQPDLTKASRIPCIGAVRHRASSDLSRLGADRIRHTGDDDEPAAIRGGQHRVSDRRDSVGRSVAGRSVRRKVSRLSAPDAVASHTRGLVGMKGVRPRISPRHRDDQGRTDDLPSETRLHLSYSRPLAGCGIKRLQLLSLWSIPRRRINRCGPDHPQSRANFGV